MCYRLKERSISQELYVTPVMKPFKNYMVCGECVYIIVRNALTKRIYERRSYS